MLKYTKATRAGLLALFACLFLQLALAAQVLAAANVQTRFDFAREDNGGIVAALTLSIPAGSHAYANDPGDVGRPASLSLVLEGETAPLPVYYPKGAIQRDTFDKNATINVYEGEETLFVAVPGTGSGKDFSADLSLLLCSSTNCTPLDVTLTGRVPADPGPLDRAPWKEKWTRLAAEVAPVTPEGAGGMPMFSMAGDAGPVDLSSLPQAMDADDGTGEAPGGGADGQEAGAVEGAPAQAADRTAQGGVGGAAAGRLPAPEGFDFEIRPVFADTSVEIYGLGKALLLGILAGLLLNAMPCVLPVLTFKVTGLLMANAHGKESLKRFREHNIFFAAGVLTLFTCLGVVFGAMDMMWGQLYQSQEFLLVMLVLVFLMGLSMLGVFTLPAMDFKSLNRERNPKLQAYLTGLVSTFLATPCSGPLLGGVLGWAFTQPLVILVVVFWAVGIGMALPYIVLCLFPNLVRILPRPGAWMVMFEHVLGFFLLGTALYLLSILPDEKHVPVLAALLVTALAAFLWGQTCPLSAPKLRRRVGGAAFFGIIVLASFFALRMERTPTAWAEFSPVQFTEYLGEKPMVVEFTADWCPNCKFVEATVFTEERLKSVRRNYDAEFIRVDLTDANAWGTKLLEMLGSRSIPLTALFPAGDKASSPTVLRDVFTGASFDKAARETFLD